MTISDLPSSTFAFTMSILIRSQNHEHCPEIGKDSEPYFQKGALALKPDGEPLHQLEVPLNAMDTHGKSVYQVEDLGANFFD
jgi:hypothetical protein